MTNTTQATEPTTHLHEPDWLPPRASSWALITRTSWSSSMGSNTPVPWHPDYDAIEREAHYYAELAVDALVKGEVRAGEARDWAQLAYDFRSARSANLAACVARNAAEKEKNA